ncbi:MAG: hypothetical protein PVF29_18255 [Desulfobacterales bacterium]|jgi:hypothetical protein
MDPYSIFPNKTISKAGEISNQFISIAINTFMDACDYVHQVPYGYNSDRDDLVILFKEKMGSCTTKHAVIATLAAELDLPIYKRIGIYPMTETIVTGTHKILQTYDLPYIPMIHCFLEYREYRVDLTEGNQNGKNQPIDTLFYTERVEPNIPAKHEYRLYRQALKDRILLRDELKGVDIKRILHAREEGLELLKSLVKRP